LPTGGVKSEGNKIVFSDRKSKIVFFGSYQDVSLMEEEINKSNYADLIWEIIERLKMEPDRTIEDVLEQMEEENGSAHTLHCIVIDFGIFKKIDSYIRMFFRREVLETIIRAGLPIEIYGWKDAPYQEFPNVTLKEAVSFDEMEEICCQVRFVLNVQPWTKSGTQERVFNAMLCGAIVVSDGCDYLREQTVDERDLILYNLAELDQLPDKIRYYMEHEEEAEQIAANGYELALANHTWEHRAQEIFEYLKWRQIHADH
jgi:hypothetical protein